MVCSPEVHIQTSSLDLNELNQRFETAHPKEILAWCVNNIPAGLVQTSAFGVTGMVIMHILYKELQPNPPVPVLFLDTLHHFPQTLELVNQSQQTYGLDLRVYRALNADSRETFAQQYGEKLWEKDVQKYHYITKVEPLQRGLSELKTIAWITGRRRDQSNSRASIPIFQPDIKHRIKINPLANWTRNDTWKYVMEHGVLYNPLHDQGYPSIGDEPLTTPVGEGEDERAGRWRGSAKTECGIHI